MKSKAMFKSQKDAIEFYQKKIDALAKEKAMSFDELWIAAHDYKFSPDESFEIMGLFRTLRALKELE